MKLGKTLYDVNPNLQRSYFSNDSVMTISRKKKQIGKTLEQLWKEGDCSMSGKSMFSSGDVPRNALARRESDRLNVLCDTMENSAWLAYSEGNMDAFDKLMTQVQQTRHQADLYTRMARGDFATA